MATSYTDPTINTNYTLRSYTRRNYLVNGVPTEVIYQNATNTRSAVTSSARSGWKGRKRDVSFAANGYPPLYSYQVNRSFRDIPINNFGCYQKSAPSNVYTYSHTICGNFINGEQYSTAVKNLLGLLRNEAIVEANDAVKNQHYSLPETIFELGKSRNMIVDAAKDIFFAARDIRRGKFNKAANRLGLSKTPKGAKRGRSFSDNWLEYRYGWTPLLLTVKGEIDRQVDQMRRKPVVHLVRRRRSSTYKSGVVGYTPSVPSMPSSGWSVSATYSSTYECGVEVGYYYSITNPNLVSMSEVGLTNPAAVAWEMVPLSFVADWFVNVGDVLDSLDTWIGKQFRAGYITEFSNGQTVHTVTPGISTSFTSTGLPQGGGRGWGYRVKRDILTVPPSVELQIRPKITPNRLIDAIALLKQAFK